MAEHTGRSYEGKAHKYARKVDMSPYNAYYERPAVVSLLLDVENANVLDAGCGSGWYAEYLLDHGAIVTAIDLNADFVALTEARVEQRAKVLQADLSQPLDFAADGEFDVVLCSLVMHYLKDWKPTLREFHRVLKSRGVLLFSTHHPAMDWKLFNREDYFAVELLEDDWKDFGKVTYYRRPLTAISSDLASSGFLIERLLEPQPTDEFRQVHPNGYARLSKNPWFIVIRAIKGPK